MAKGKSKGVQSKRATPPKWVWGLVAAVAVAILVYAAVHHSPPPAPKATAAVPLNNPKLPASGFTWKYRAYQISTGKPSHLVEGSHVTVVMLMASWCLYCAYVDKYVWPSLIHTPGLSVDIVDVSPQGGIGDPGPKSPPFSGHDNPAGSLSAQGMRTTMQQYVKRFDLHYPNLHVYTDPSGQSYWGLQYFPTILFVNRQGQVKRVNGALTLPQAKSLLAKFIRQG